MTANYFDKLLYSWEINRMNSQFQANKTLPVTYWYVSFRFRILQKIEYWYLIFLLCYHLEFVLFFGNFFTALYKTAVPPLFTLRVCEDIAMVEADKMLKHFFFSPSLLLHVLLFPSGRKCLLPLNFFRR